DEHHLLLDALKAKDLTQAELVLSHHIQAAGEMLVSHFSQG
ncbi:MAG: DNA-binding GntR family transcriptional regulator, partial [Phenylobacterium sp.]